MIPTAVLLFFAVCLFGQACSSDLRFIGTSQDRATPEPPPSTSLDNNGSSYGGKLTILHFGHPDFTCERKKRPQGVLLQGSDMNWYYTENRPEKCNFIFKQRVDGVSFDQTSLTAEFQGQVFVPPNAFYVTRALSGSTDFDLQDGVCADASGECTYQAAFTQLNSIASNNEFSIYLAAGAYAAVGSVVLRNQFKLNIIGASSATTVIDHQGSIPRANIFLLDNPREILLSGVTLTGGRAEFANMGGAIYGQGVGATPPKLTLNDVVFRNNSSYTYGGAVYLSNYRLEMNDVVFESNSCHGNLGCAGTALAMKSRGFVYGRNVSATLNGRQAPLGMGQAVFDFEYVGFEFDGLVMSANLDPITIASKHLGDPIGNSVRLLRNSRIVQNQGVGIYLHNGFPVPPADLNIIDSIIDGNYLGQALDVGRNLMVLNTMGGATAPQRIIFENSQINTESGTNCHTDPANTMPVLFENLGSAISDSSCTN